MKFIVKLSFIEHAFATARKSEFPQYRHKQLVKYKLAKTCFQTHFQHQNSYFETYKSFRQVYRQLSHLRETFTSVVAYIHSPRMSYLKVTWRTTFFERE
jgi:hypothetical protein